MFHAPRKLLQLSLVSFFLCGLFWAIPHTTAASIIQSDWSGGGGVDHSFVVDNIDTYDISDMISTSADSLTLVPLPNNSDRFLTTYLGIGTTFSKVVDTGSGYVIANANNLYRLAYNGQLQNSYQLESQYGTPNINSVLKVGDNIVLAGGTSSYQPNGYIIILDGDMNTVAQYHLTGTEESGSIQYEPITFMKPTSDGGYIITMGGGSYTDLIMIKLNSDFSVAWGHWYYTRFYFSVGDIVEQAGGGYVISGVMDRDIDNGQNLDIEGFLMSVSPGGYVSAAVFHDGANYTGSLKIGSEIIAYGTEDNNSMLTSIAVSSGNISINWQKILSGVTIRTAYPGTGGHYYLAGTTSDNYLWLAEINENQEIVWSKRYDTIATPFAIMTTATNQLAVFSADNNNNLYYFHIDNNGTSSYTGHEYTHSVTISNNSIDTYEFHGVIDGINFEDGSIYTLGHGLSNISQVTYNSENDDTATSGGGAPSSYVYSDSTAPYTYPALGHFISTAIIPTPSYADSPDGEISYNWDPIQITADLPAGTAISAQYSINNGYSWFPATTPPPTSNSIKYLLQLSSTDPTVTPTVTKVEIPYTKIDAHAPVVEAGPTSTSLKLGDTLTLNGTVRSLVGNSVTGSWAITDNNGTSDTLTTGATSLTPKFTPSQEGKYTLTLTGTNSTTEFYTTDTIDIYVYSIETYSEATCSTALAHPADNDTVYFKIVDPRLSAGQTITISTADSTNHTDIWDSKTITMSELTAPAFCSSALTIGAEAEKNAGATTLLSKRTNDVFAYQYTTAPTTQTYTFHNVDEEGKYRLPPYHLIQGNFIPEADLSDTPADFSQSLISYDQTDDFNNVAATGDENYLVTHSTNNSSEDEAGWNMQRYSFFVGEQLPESTYKITWEGFNTIDSETTAQNIIALELYNQTTQLWDSVYEAANNGMWGNFEITTPTYTAAQFAPYISTDLAVIYRVREYEYSIGGGGMYSLYTDFTKLEVTAPATVQAYSEPDTIPILGSIMINAGADYTNSTTVTVTNDITGATDMRYKNGLTGTYSAWEPYAASKTWTLDPSLQNTTKTVWAEFKNPTTTRELSASIELNTAPTATQVRIDGLSIVGLPLSAGYTFADINGDTESAHTYQWYAGIRSGTGTELIMYPVPGATSNIYTPIVWDEGKVFQLGVTVTDARGATSSESFSSITPYIIPNDRLAVAKSSGSDLTAENLMNYSIPVFTGVSSSGSYQLPQEADTILIGSNDVLKMNDATETIDPGTTVIAGRTIRGAFTTVTGRAPVSPKRVELISNGTLIGPKINLWTKKENTNAWADITLYPNTKIYSDSSWDGNFVAPHITTETVSAPNYNVISSMAIGSTDTDLILDKPARLFIVRDYANGEVYDPENQDVYYRSAGQDWKKISQECTWEYTLAGLVKTTEIPINLTFPGVCYERDPYGTTIWTYHFTEFAVMVPDYDPDDPDGDPIGGHTGTNLWLLITGDSVTVGSPANVTFDDVHVQSTTQNADVALSGTGNYFYVDDMLGADEGYNTTLQMSNLTAAGGGSIPLENIGLHIPLGAPTVIEGSENSRVTYNTALNNDWNFFSDTPYSFIYRQNALNDGLLGRYGLLPYFRIVVPGFQHLGVYTGTLTYTLL